MIDITSEIGDSEKNELGGRLRLILREAKRQRALKLCPDGATCASIDNGYCNPENPKHCPQYKINRGELK